MTGTSFEVGEPILSSPYEEPAEHWWIEEGRSPERRSRKSQPAVTVALARSLPIRSRDTEAAGLTVCTTGELLDALRGARGD